MDNRIAYCFGAGIFLLAAVSAPGSQERSSPSTTEGPTTVTGREATTQEADRPELHRRNPRYQLCKDDVLQLTFALTPDFNQTGRKRHHIGKSSYVYRRLGKEPSMDFQADKIAYTPVTKITADYPDPKLAGKKFHYAVSPRNSNLPGWPTSPPTM